ncbi:FG-GAP-like repeat-containing protein, partial [Nostoc sp.]|uniref:FG-GAP-like repeat-containing protein n=1 Tax=Nostoc sp. TaxID=1180 RepID=UPI002FF6BCC6
YSVTVGDFNGDGKLDLATANRSSNNVSVLLGNGTGGFATATNFTVNGPQSVTMGDFNGDGKLDLATANHYYNNVSVLLGDGTGGFATATNFTVNGHPVSVTVGDFNGDGKLDLATANHASNNVSVLLGDGTGGFATATNFTVGSNPRSVTVGDFNGDSKLDLAAANASSNTVSVLLNVNLAPVTTATNTALAYTENDPATIIDAGISVSDADSPNLSSATVSITNGLASAEDILAFTNQNGITGSYTNGVLTLTGSATVTQYQTALQSVTYQNSSENPSTTARTISFVVNDGSLNSNPATRDIDLTAVNDAPTDLALDKTDVNDKAAANTVIGTFSSTDPDQNDNFAYSLVSGIDDVDNNAFTIDGNTLKINNSPDFKTKPSYEIRVRTTDDGNLTFEKGLTINVNNGDEIPNRLTNPDDDVFNIQGEDVTTKLEIKLTGHNSQLVNELGLFTVDDDKGTINGIAPGAEGYAKAALERSKVILSAIANTPNGFDTNNLSRLLELNSGQNFRFLLVQDGTLDAVRNNPNSIGKLLFSSVSTQKIIDLGNDGFSLAWKDTSGKSATDFNDLVVKINQTNQALPLGTNLQGQFQGEVIDLRDVKQSVKAEFSVYREASYNDYVGFYQVTDENGGIDTNGDGKADILTGQAGYTQAAVRGRVAGIDLTASNQATATSTATFQPGAIFVPFIIVNGRPDALLDNNSNNDPTVYFPFLGANSDQSDHIRLLASNTFGFEDLPGGGDKDFNDVIIKANLTTTI